MLVNTYPEVRFSCKSKLNHFTDWHCFLSFRERSRQAGKFTFSYEAVLEHWSCKDFSYSSPTMYDYDQREMFCFYLFPGNNQNRKVTELSMQSNVLVEYTYTTLLQTDTEKQDAVKQAKKHGSHNHAGPKNHLAIMFCGLTVGFGNATAALENLPTGFGKPKPPETNYV